MYPLNLSSNAVNLRRLIVLRNIAILGQVLMLLLVVYGLGVDLPARAIGGAIALLTLLNLLTWLRLQRTGPVTDVELFAHLLLDVLALTIMLYFSGGSANPFVLVYLLPITLTAAALPGFYTWIMAAITVACYSLLMLVYWPMPRTHTQNGNDFDLHVLGMWLAFVMSAGLIAYFVVKMSQTLRDRDQALAVLREDQLRNERILALGTLATGAAHELGTPLSTMAVLLKDLEMESNLTHDVAEKLGILRGQVMRCKHILSNLTASAGQARAEAGGGMDLDRYLAQIVTNWQGIRPAAKVVSHWHGTRPAPRILAEQTLSQAIMNILNNAADASQDQMEVEGQWSERELRLEVRDRGPGLAPTVEKNAGTLFFTTKDPELGLGLGLFLARATLSRFGGSVQLFNREGGGAGTRLILPLADLLVDIPS